MKKIIIVFITCFIFIFCSNRGFTQDYKLGLGIRLSNATPTLSNSISVKYFTKPNTAIEGLLSFGGSRFGIGGLYEPHTPMGTPGLQWFYGIGAYVGFQDRNTYLGPTGAIGLDYKFDKIPLNIWIFPKIYTPVIVSHKILFPFSICIWCGQ
jgi:hypothetical protein